jgi:hypothetical protein
MTDEQSRGGADAAAVELNIIESSAEVVLLVVKGC